MNGILADDGAAAHKLASGDRIWWDHHDWGASQDVRAVVGAYPEPFVSGVDGKKLPVRIDCADDAGDVCDEVGERLSARGVKAGRSAAERLRRRGRAARQGRPVGASCGGTPPCAGSRRGRGVRRLRRPSRRAARSQLLDPDGRGGPHARPRRRAVAATRLGGEAPTWVVTGTDAPGVAAAAAQLREDALADRFALAVEDGRPVSLPVQTAGRGRR